VLQEEFLEPMGISQYRLAKDVSVPPRRINEILHGKRAVTADTTLRLGRYFGTAPRFWLNLQAQYDLDTEQDRLGDRLDSEVTSRASGTHTGRAIPGDGQVTRCPRRPGMRRDGRTSRSSETAGQRRVPGWSGTDRDAAHNPEVAGSNLAFRTSRMAFAPPSRGLRVDAGWDVE
jgi:addiction module HigA family antidote